MNNQVTSVLLKQKPDEEIELSVLNKIVAYYNKFFNSFNEGVYVGNENLISLTTNYYYNVYLETAPSFFDTKIKKIEEQKISFDSNHLGPSRDCSIFEYIKDTIKIKLKEIRNYSTLTNPLWHQEKLLKFLNLHPLDIIFSTQYSALISEPKMGKTTFFKNIIKKFITKLDNQINNRVSRSIFTNDTFINYILEDKSERKIIPFYFNLSDFIENFKSNTLIEDFIKSICGEVQKNFFDKYDVVLFIDGFDDILYTLGETRATEFLSKILFQINNYFLMGNNSKTHITIACRNEHKSKLKFGAYNIKTFHLLPLDCEAQKSLIISLNTDSNIAYEDKYSIANDLLKKIKDLKIDENLCKTPYILSKIYNFYNSCNNLIVFDKKNILKDLYENVLEEVFLLINKDINKRSLSILLNKDTLDNIFLEVAYTSFISEHSEMYLDEVTFFGIISKHLKDDKINLFNSIIWALQIHANFIVEKYGRYMFISYEFNEFLSARYIHKKDKEDESIALIKKLALNIRKNHGLLDHFFKDCNEALQSKLITNFLCADGQNEILNFNDIYFAAILYSINPKALFRRDFELFKRLTLSLVLSDIPREKLFNDYIDPSINMRIEVGKILGNYDIDKRFERTRNHDIEMVFINKGAFMYGLNEYYIQLYKNKLDREIDLKREIYLEKNKPKSKRMNIDYDFEISKYPVTVSQFKEFIRDDGYNPNKDHWAFSKFSKEWIEKLNKEAEVIALRNYENDESKDFNEYKLKALYPEIEHLSGNTPIVNISWIEAVAYTKWLSIQTGESYRLPYEWEWEYVARRMFNEHVKLSFEIIHNKSDEELLKNMEVTMEDFKSYDQENFDFTIADFCVNEDKKIDDYEEVVKSQDPNIPQFETLLNNNTSHYFSFTLNKGIPKYVINCRLKIKVNVFDEVAFLTFNGLGLIEEESTYNKEIFKHITLECGDKYHEYHWGNYFNNNLCICDQKFSGPIPVGLFSKELSSPICDLNGNIWEWCMSSIDENNPQLCIQRENDIKLSEVDSYTRAIVRGGAYLNLRELSRNTFRGRDLIGDRIKLDRQGFRIVKDLEMKS